MRRRALLGAWLAGALGACDDRTGGKTAAPSASGPWREVPFPADAAYAEPELAAILVEPQAPTLIALHGRGEAGRGLEAGARGWRDDYALDRAQARVHQPPLREDDFKGFVRPERLAALNASLAANPYRGLTVACPYAPALRDRSPAGAEPFGRFLTERLLPRARSLSGAAADRARTSIDGVSMGGRLALLIGLSNPAIFGAVGALQPALSVSEADAFAALARGARTAAPQHLRLVSSDADPFLPAVKALSAALTRDGLEHQLVITPGPHDYVWNEGPGAYEMLLWHERVLRGLPAP